ncbi:MAG: pilus assembly protein [Halioglobus sp.]
MIKLNVRELGLALTTLCLIATGISVPTQADDTEIFRGSLGTATTGRPKVLILFDNSGSMGSNVTSQRPPYDPNNTTYANVHPSDRIYYSTNGRPPSAGSGRYFFKSRNRCAESYNALDTYGYLAVDSGAFASGDRWYNDIFTSDIHIDCQADIINSNSGNGTGAGSPGNGYYPTAPASTSPSAGDEYTTNINDPGIANITWGPHTFYSAHYMDWYHDSSLVTTRTRLSIAQEVVTSLISANTAIDFGLGVFNHNSSSSNDGGRIVNRIINNMTATDRTNLTSMVNGLNATTWTPLCETSYEAYRYLSGQTSVYAQEAGTASPAADPNAYVSGTTYRSPSTDCAVTYVILMTDGAPTYDTDANAKIKALAVPPATITCSNYADGNGGTSENCMPELAEYMANTDLDGDPTNGDQFAITYTIGFTTNQPLLQDTAIKGGSGANGYFTANDAAGLAAAFSSALLSILDNDATFTSPAVAVDTFTRTQSRNDVFFAMFRPNNRVDWPGNIKKLNLAISGGNAILVDSSATPVPAIDTSSGLISALARTYWLPGTDPADGPTVQEGGVGRLLETRTPSTRVVYTNTGSGGALEAFNPTNVDATAFGFGASANPLADLHNFWGVTSQAELDKVIYWAIGYSDNGTTTPVDVSRGWLLGDMLHGKPLVINYGARGAFTQANPELRIAVGTNGSFLHMFSNDDGTEDWAFVPKELAPVITRRYTNPLSADHAYGIDSPPIVHVKDLNRDGTIDSTVGDKVFLYFGLRRGGRALYALDVSNPDSPSYKWRIDETTSGFSELGQTWSIPTVARIPGYADGNGKPKPVLIFGAGYDTNKDGTGIATNDSMGRGIYIIDADTGALVWSITPAGNSATNMQASILHSVPAGITPVDSNGDELVDRIYFVDTGGNIWRVDLPGNTLPSSSQNTWRIVKLAELNGGTAITDRRFFSAPDVVNTRSGNEAFDAVLIGSGDRTNPKATDVLNRFYMIRDTQLTPYTTAHPTTTDCALPTATDFRCDLPLRDGTGSNNQFYDATSNIIQTGNASQQTAAKTALDAANGWYIDLAATGEKAVARSLTIDGRVFFTTFSPDAAQLNLCVPTPGTARLYAVGLQDASEVVDFNADSNYERSWVIGSLVPDTPSPHFGSDGEIRLLLPPGSGTIGNPFETGASLPAPYGSYWFQEDY